MKKPILLLFLIGLLTQVATAGEITCKTEFTMAPYKKNLLGKYVREKQDKFNNSIIEGTMSVVMPINEDRSAYFTYSSHSDRQDRLTTYYKAVLGTDNNVHVSLNFYVKGQETIPQVDLVVNGQKSAFIELEKPQFWKQDSELKIMIETVYYHCSLVEPR